MLRCKSFHRNLSKLDKKEYERLFKKGDGANGGVLRPEYDGDEASRYRSLRQSSVQTAELQYEQFRDLADTLLRDMGNARTPPLIFSTGLASEGYGCASVHHLLRALDEALEQKNIREVCFLLREAKLRVTIPHDVNHRPWWILRRMSETCADADVEAVDDSKEDTRTIDLIDDDEPLATAEAASANAAILPARDEVSWPGGHEE